MSIPKLAFYINIASIPGFIFNHFTKILRRKRLAHHFIQKQTHIYAQNREHVYSTFASDKKRNWCFKKFYLALALIKHLRKIFNFLKNKLFTDSDPERFSTLFERVTKKYEKLRSKILGWFTISTDRCLLYFHLT